MKDYNFRATGAVKRLDAQGRIVLPIDVRAKLGINENDLVEILENESGILIRRYEPSDACVICHMVKETIFFNGSRICHDCAKAIAGEMAKTQQ